MVSGMLLLPFALVGGFRRFFEFFRCSLEPRFRLFEVLFQLTNSLRQGLDLTLRLQSRVAQFLENLFTSSLETTLYQ